MPTLTTPDGTRLFYKDCGAKDAQPIVFHHGWPLSADDWDNQMLFFLREGNRVIAHDRRGHGRSDQTDIGNDMDTYAADVDALVRLLNLRNAIHVGHSTGGGEVIRYVARSEAGRVAKAVLIGAITPIMLATDRYPGGLPMTVFDSFRDALARNRVQFFLYVPSGPFYGFNRDGAEVSKGLIRNWWRQGMSGGAKARYDCIAAFSETDFHRRSPGSVAAGARHARRRRPGRAGRCVGARGNQAAFERHAENLPGALARSVCDASRYRQRRPARLLQGLSGVTASYARHPKSADVVGDAHRQGDLP